MSNTLCRFQIAPLKSFASTAVVALLIGCASAAVAQNTPSTQEASLPAGNQTSSHAANTSSSPLDQNEVREVQNQLIALGFDPGPADGQIGPATLAAAQHFDQDRGGDGRVSIDAELLERLMQDKGPRLTYEQVLARSQSRTRTRSYTAAPSSGAAASNQFGNVVQQIAPLVGAMIANSNNNRGYGPGYYGPGPGYYGPPPGYYGPGPGYYRQGYGYGY